MVGHRNQKKPESIEFSSMQSPSSRKQVLGDNSANSVMPSWSDSRGSVSWISSSSTSSTPSSVSAAVGTLLRLVKYSIIVEALFRHDMLLW